MNPNPNPPTGPHIPQSPTPTPAASGFAARTPAKPAAPRLSAEQLRTQFQSMLFQWQPEMTLVTDVMGRVLLANQTYYQCTGFNPTDVLERPLSVLLAPQQPSQFSLPTFPEQNLQPGFFFSCDPSIAAFRTKTAGEAFAALVRPVAMYLAPEQVFAQVDKIFFFSLTDMVYIQPVVASMFSSLPPEAQQMFNQLQQHMR